MRGAIYVDGFNLYHAIDDLGENYLKWLNLRRLGELIARGHARTIGRVVYCTAFFPGDFGKKKRHQAYVDALELVDVECLRGHTVREPMECKSPDCLHRWDEPREKETDINVALSLYGDAHRDLYDVAFLITADSDQAATLRAMRNEFPNKKLVTVVPPGREPSKHLRDLSHATLKLTSDHIDECVFPGLVSRSGKKAVIRPSEYDPPIGWVHPDDRP